MIKKLSLVLSALMLSASMMADPIDVKRAKALATQFMPVAGGQPQLVKRAERRSTSGRRLAPAYRNVAPYYIFSRGENQGFVIVSGDDALPEVLGYTESGNFDEANMPPFLRWYLDYYGSMIEDAQELKLPRRAPEVTADARIDIAPLISTHWNQSWPYNNLCPDLKNGNGKCVTGCVATAAAQVLYYWRKDLPDETLGSTTSYTYGDQAKATKAFPKGTPLKWGLMRTTYEAEPEEYRTAVATLMAVVGGGAYLTYGSSTAGYPSNCVNVFKNIFGMNGGTHQYKDQGGSDLVSDEAWATQLYKELLKKAPILYAGCREYKDDNGATQAEGHAIVIDGYQAGTGYFHFNMGWGGSSDGYYTVARSKSPSWGFNDSFQEYVIGVSPRKQRLNAKMSFPDGFHLNHDNLVKVTIQNHGTLDYSGVYLFVSAGKSLPTSLSSAKGIDTETILPNDGSSVTLKMSARPTAARTCYLTLTDKNLNVITQKEILPDVMQNKLTLNYIDVLGSATKEKHNGAEYTVIADSRSTLVANVENHSDAPYQDSPRMEVYVSEDDGVTFTKLGERQSSSTRIEAKSAGNFEFALTSTEAIPLETGKLYYAALRHPLSTRSDTYVEYASNDSVARFLFTGDASTLSATLEGKVLKFTGSWSAYEFVQIANKTANRNACIYDLTEVENIGRLPQLEGKVNALYYLAADAKTTGVNVVKQGETAMADELLLQAGTDYESRGNIQAAKATFKLNLKPNRWYLVTMPFAASVPDGIVVKRIDTHASTGISSKTTLMDHVEAGQTYLVMTSSEESMEFTAKNVEVVSTPTENADPAVIGSFVAIEAPAGSCWINNAETQMFTPSDEAFAVTAFSGYFRSEEVTREFRANSEMTIDPGYQKLGVAISDAVNKAVDYRMLIQQEAYQTLRDSIQVAKHVFTTRPMTRARDITAYTTQFQAAIDSCTLLLASDISDVEINMTAFITNPSFETGGLSTSSPGSLKGWTTGGTGIAVRDASSVNYRGVGADGTYLVYSYISATKTGNGITQTISNLPAGLYALTAKVGTDADSTVTLFAGDQEIKVGSHSFGQYYLNDARVDSIVVKAGDNLTIGVKEGAWYKADDFHLYYVRSLLPHEDPVAIQDLTVLPKQPTLFVEAVEGGIRVTTLATTPVVVYAPTGSQVARRMISGTCTIALPRGMYLVGGKKIMVR